MNCPTCSQMMDRLDVAAATLRATWRCARCGTLVESRGQGPGSLVASVPQTVDGCRAALQFLEQDAGGETIEHRTGLVGGLYTAQQLRDALGVPRRVVR